MSQAQITNLSDTSRKLSLNVPAAELRQAYDSRLQRMSKRVKVDGFRPGKVPLSVVKRLYGNDVLIEVADNLANEKLRAVIKEHKLDPINIGAVDKMPQTAEEEWNFAITFDVIPPFRLPEPQSIEATLLRAEVTEFDLDATLENIRRSQPDYIEVDRALAEGDHARVDFVYQLTGADAPEPQLDKHKTPTSELSGSHGNERWKISPDMPVTGMCDAMLGLRKGETRRFSLPVDEKSANPQWRGKTIHMLVEALAVEEEKLPELNAAFAERLGIKDTKDPLGELRTRTNKDLEIRLKSRLDAINKGRLFEALTAATSVDLPQSVIDQHNAQMRREMVARLLPPEELKRDPHPEIRLKPELFTDKARERAKQSEVFSRLVREHKIEANQDRVRQLIATAASEYDDPQAFITSVSKDQHQLRHFTFMALEDAAYHWLLEHCNPAWKDVSMEQAFSDNLDGKSQENQPQGGVKAGDEEEQAEPPQ